MWENFACGIRNHGFWNLESHKRLNSLTGVYLILRVQESGAGADGKQLKDIEAFILTSETSSTKLIYHLLSKISRVLKNGGISSPYF